VVENRGGGIPGGVVASGWTHSHLGQP
jgi:hypothetical protein